MQTIQSQIGAVTIDELDYWDQDIRNDLIKLGETSSDQLVKITGNIQNKTTSYTAYKYFQELKLNLAHLYLLTIGNKELKLEYDVCVQYMQNRIYPPET